MAGRVLHTLFAVAVAACLWAPAAAAADGLPPATVEARERFFGAGNVDAAGNVRSDRVILSWFSVASLAAAIDGRVVLLDTYIHKGEDAPNYVPTTTEELIALAPEAIFIGHGHFDHAARAGRIAARTGAPVVGTPEHCEQASEEAAVYTDASPPLRCIEAVERGSLPGAQVRELRPLGDRVAVTVFKHVHSAAEPPDGEGHETSITTTPLPDANAILLHPPGPSVIAGLNPAGDEGSSLVYQFRVGAFSLVWHDSSGPLRTQAPQVFDVLRALPPTDVQVGSALGFNDPTNGMRDPVDYVQTLRPKLFIPIHHDFVAEYGASKSLEGVFRREMAKRDPLPTDVRWIYDPFDYLRPELMTFEVADARWRDPGEAAPPCLPRRARTSGRRSIGLVRTGLTRTALARRAGAPSRSGSRTVRWCVDGGGEVVAVFGSRSERARARLIATTAPGHRTRTIRAGSSSSALARRFPRLARVAPGLYRAFPGSNRVFGVRRGRVAFVAVADAAALARPASLRRLAALSR